ncbi:RNA polymerase II transcription regulator recruiting protein [Aureococcus anophagefferens]|nr:RNA polymerase II transcription regulator recruiting protein [Aureococcus anophagefferens]
MADDAAARRAASAGAPEAQKTFAKACANSLEWHYKAAQRRGAPPSRPTILESDSKRPGWYEPPDATAAPPRVERRAEATDMQNQIDAVEFGLKQLRASADEPTRASSRADDRGDVAAEGDEDDAHGRPARRRHDAKFQIYVTHQAAMDLEMLSVMVFSIIQKMSLSGLAGVVNTMYRDHHLSREFEYLSSVNDTNVTSIRETPSKP